MGFPQRVAALLFLPKWKFLFSAILVQLQGSNMSFVWVLTMNWSSIVLDHNLKLDATGNLSPERRQAKIAWRDSLIFPRPSLPSASLGHQRTVHFSIEDTRHRCTFLIYLYIPEQRLGPFHRFARLSSTRSLNTMDQPFQSPSYSNFTRWRNEDTVFVTPVSVEGAQELPNYQKNNWQCPFLWTEGRVGFFFPLKPGAKHWWTPVSGFWAEVNKSWANTGSVFLKIKKIAIWRDAAQPQHHGFQIRVSPPVLNTADGGWGACYHQLSAFPTGGPNASFKALILQNC